MRIRRAIGTVLLASGVVAHPMLASAQDKRACVANHEEAQVHRQQGRLMLAREKLVACAQEGCPPMVRSDCAPWLDAVQNEVPSVVLAARDAQGTELLDVRVFTDGELTTQRLDGKAIELDPGEHIFRFEYRSAPAVEQRVLIRQGEKARLLSAVLMAPTRDKPTDPPVLAWVLGGAGAIALGSAAYLTIAAKGERDDLTCKGFCSDEDLAPISSKLQAANVSLAIGAALAGVTTYLLLAGPRSVAQRPPPPLVSRRFSSDVRCEVE